MLDSISANTLFFSGKYIGMLIKQTSIPPKTCLSATRLVSLMQVTVLLIKWQMVDLI